MDPYLVRARVIAPHGVKGLVKVAPCTDYPERLLAQTTWRLRTVAGVTEYRVAGLDEYRGGWLVKFAGIDDRDGADGLRGAEVVVDEADLPPLPAGEYYWHQLLGLRVVTTAGAPVGTIKEILRTGSNEVYVTEGPLIPAIDQVIERVDLTAGEVVIRPLPGLLEP